ncbi:sclareol synthase, chloroplastic-like [Salvia miltiorrhiza]|uniref:sclareol synthase, chloroplastic-like n=1 Tax=Salvia miltiorrhiza TaxID=226208 RepID=UPI0025ACD5BD|nr:sclareol synthase, chloroplastic-like [Salvia miltiorrhiza]
MSLAFNTGVTPFSGHRVGSRRENLRVQGFPMATTNKPSLTVKCSLTTTIDLMGKIKEKLKGEDDSSPATASVEAVNNIPSNLCIIDTLQRLGVDKYFQSEINTILDDTYKLWKQKHKVIYSTVSIHAMAFRLLRVKGYEVSSEELAPYANQERFSQQTIDVAMIIELYRAAQERIFEEESSLEKILAWTTTFLKHQLQTNSISDKKLHKLVEFYLNNYHGITIRLGVRRNLDLYDMSYYQAIKDTDRFSNLCNEDFLAFARQDFATFQVQNQKELQQLQRWYADCRLDTLKFGRDVVLINNFLASLVIGDLASDHARLASAKTSVLVTLIDDLFDHGGSTQECYKILELVKEWKEKPATAEYGSEAVEILFTALYNTVNDLAEMAHVEQGRSVKQFIIGLWVEILSVFKIELDTWSDGTQLSLDEYMSSSWVSISYRILVLVSMQFIGAKLSDQMLVSQECTDLSKHGSMVARLLNDVCSFEKERNENTGSSMSILLAVGRDGRGVSEEEAIAEIKEIVEYHRRKVMQIVYKKGTIFPRKCKDIFMEACKVGCYVYSSSDQFTSPQQLKDDLKSLLYYPLFLIKKKLILFAILIIS